MNMYRELKEKQQKEVNDFPMFFAFSNEQFNEGMKKLGLEPTETDKIYSLGMGGYYRKTDSSKLKDLFNRHEKEMDQAIENDDKFIFDMFNYELGNHEYNYTRDISETLDALGFTIEDINNNKRLIKGLNDAVKYQEEMDA